MTTQRVGRRWRARSLASRHFRGQALVEFALILPIFLFMLFGLVDMGRFVYLNSTLSQAAREAARVESVQAGWVGHTDANCNQPGGPVCPANLAALRTNVLAAANRMMAPFGAVTDAELYTSCATTAPTNAWTTKTCASPTGLASVRIQLSYVPITPFIGRLFSSITAASAATMVIN